MYKKKRIFNSITVFFLITGFLTSCTPSLTRGERVQSEKMVTESVRAIDEHYDTVRSALIEAKEYSEEEFASYGTLNGETVTRGVLESGNDDVLTFLAYSYEGKGIDEVLSAAKSLVPEKEWL